MSDPLDVLYADLPTVPGSVLVFSFAHRGRCAGPDSAALKVGPAEGVQNVLVTAVSNATWTTYTGAPARTRGGSSACVRRC
jgi:hypothetical protein